MFNCELFVDGVKKGTMNLSKAPCVRRLANITYSPQKEGIHSAHLEMRQELKRQCFLRGETYRVGGANKVLISQTRVPGSTPSRGTYLQKQNNTYCQRQNSVLC